MINRILCATGQGASGRKGSDRINVKGRCGFVGTIGICDMGGQKCCGRNTCRPGIKSDGGKVGVNILKRGIEIGQTMNGNTVNTDLGRTDFAPGTGGGIKFQRD